MYVRPGEKRGVVICPPDVTSLLSAVRGAARSGLTKDHPDPDRFHLKIVAAVAKLYLDGGTKVGINSSGKGSPLAAAFERAGLGAPDFAFFQDFTRRACLWLEWEEGCEMGGTDHRNNA